MSEVRESAAAPYAFVPYVVKTHNASTQSENRMHSDDVARSFGFRGGLVPGVAVFAHMTHPLVERFGLDWLAHGEAEVTFAKPAYEGEFLTIGASDAVDGAGTVDVTCANAAGESLARMTARIAAHPAPADARADVAPAAPVVDRPVVTWDLMEIGKPFPALPWRPTQADNVEWCRDVRDDLPIYRDGDASAVHPGLTLRQANHVLRGRFVLPAWIHVASRLRFLEPLRIGPAYEVRAIPEEKWEKKGHAFVRLHVAVRNGNRTVAEVLHTAIFLPRKVAR
jgi:acyl dehydratase